MKYINTAKVFIIIFAIFVSRFVTAGADVEKQANIVSPDIYSVLLENENVLVLKMTLKPGQSDLWHKHNAETVYFEQGGSAQIKTAKDKLISLNIPDGYVMWHDQWEHQVTNTGDSTITAIIVERKADTTKEH